MAYIVDSFINILQSVIISLFFIRYFNIKERFSAKFVKIFFISSLFLYLEVESYITAFDSYGVFIMMLFNYLICTFLFENIWLEKVFYNIIITLFCVFSAIIGGSIIGFYCNTSYINLVKDMTFMKMAGMLLTQVILIAMIFVFDRIIRKYDFLYDLKFTMLVLLIPVLSFIIVTLSLKQPMYSQIDLFREALIIFCMIIVNVLVFIMLHYESKQYQEKSKKEIELLSYKQQYADIEEINSKYQMTQKHRHEIKRIMDLIYDLLEDKKYNEALEYLKAFDVDKTICTENVLYTHNFVMNYLLNRKVQICHDEKIRVKCMVSGTIDGITDIDIYILAGNLLDNAIEAASKADKPFISILICGNEECLYFEISNTLQPQALQNNPELKSTKKNPAGHGYGIRNVKDIVNKYNGTIEFNSDRKEIFSCYVTLLKEQP